MHRRNFLGIIGSTAMVWPRSAANAQRNSTLPTIGYLAANAEPADRPRRTALVHRLTELGWVEGQSVRIEYRWADGSPKRAAEIAPELLRSPIDLIVTSGDAFVLAVKKATTTIQSSSCRPVIPLATV
jgi:putative ABC transport system substrate-binding protein